MHWTKLRCQNVVVAYIVLFIFLCPSNQCMFNGLTRIKASNGKFKLVQKFQRLSGGRGSIEDNEGEIPLSEIYGDDYEGPCEAPPTPDTSDTAEENSRLAGPITAPVHPLRLTPYNHIPFIEVWPGLGPRVQPGQVPPWSPPPPPSPPPQGSFITGG